MKRMPGFALGLLLLLWTVSIPFTWGEMLQGRVSKIETLPEARDAAFSGPIPSIQMGQYAAFDPSFRENQHVIRQGGGRVTLPDGGAKVVTVFEDGDYGVRLFTQSDIEQNIYPPGLYYTPQGALKAIEITYGNEYPYKAFKYAYGNHFEPLFQHGELMNVRLNVKRSDTYIFWPNGQLIAHWVGNACYNTNGSSCGQRQTHRFNLSEYYPR